MAVKTFRIPAISCEHCVSTIEHQLSGIKGVTFVVADAAAQVVTVEWNEPPANWDAVRTKLAEINYPPADK